MLEKAFNLKNAGRLEESLDLYNTAFNALVKDAEAYAKNLEEVFCPENGGNCDKKISAKYLAKFKEHLKKDKCACVVSNNMAVIFAQMGEMASAKIFFEQAIDLTPEGEKYDDPFIGLEVLNGMR